MREEAVLFGEKTPLVGILSYPSDSRKETGFPATILLNAGIVGRVGPNRLYVKIARSLAALGSPVLRFDLSGIGDSPGRRDHLPFDRSAVSETLEAMGYLAQATGAEHFVLMGICSGANLSYEAARGDSRVIGAVLINPRYHLHRTGGEAHSSVRSRALTRHYVRIAFFSSFSAKIWSNFLSGRARWRSVVKAARGIRPGSLVAPRRAISSVVSQTEGELRLLADRGTRLLHIYSEGDEGLDYLHTILGDKVHGERTERLLELEIIRAADHTFTLLWSQQRLLKVICDWVQAMARG